MSEIKHIHKREQRCGRLEGWALLPQTNSNRTREEKQRGFVVNLAKQCQIDLGSGEVESVA